MLAMCLHAAKSSAICTRGGIAELLGRPIDLLPEPVKTPLQFWWRLALHGQLPVASRRINSLIFEQTNRKILRRGLGGLVSFAVKSRSHQ